MTNQEIAEAVEKVIAPMVECPRCGALLEIKQAKMLVDCYLNYIGKITHVWETA